MSEFLQPELPGMPTMVELDGGAYDLLREVNTCTDAIKKWEERKLSAHDQLMKILTGGCEDEATYEGTWNGRGVVKATVYIERRFNSRAFQSDHPALYDSYRQPTTRSRLTPDPAA